MKICNQSVEKRKIWFLRWSDRILPGWSDLIHGQGQIYPGKGPKKSQKVKRKFLGQQVLFGTKFLKFGPKRVNLATLHHSRSLENEIQLIVMSLRITIEQSGETESWVKRYCGCHTPRDGFTHRPWPGARRFWGPRATPSYDDSLFFIERLRAVM